MNPFLTNADTGLCSLAAKHFRRQAKRLAEQLEGVRAAEDIESIHRARVASRRLRAGLRMFERCMDPTVHASWRKRIRRITASLGGARDADVQIEFLSRVLAEVNEPSLAPGLARLLAKLEKERERWQPNVVKAVGKLEQSKVLKEMQAAPDRLRDDGGKAKGTITSPVLRQEAEHRIESQLSEMLAHEGGLADPSATVEHHAMRIAVKRLRYTLEIVAPVFRGALNDIQKTTKRLQTLLGDLHDCDVWVARLADYLEQRRQRTIDHFGHEGPMARLKPGISYLQEARARDREFLFVEIVEFWAHLTAVGTWEELRRLAATPNATLPAAPLPEAASNDESSDAEVPATATAVDEPSLDEPSETCEEDDPGPAKSDRGQHGSGRLAACAQTEDV